MRTQIEAVDSGHREREQSFTCKVSQRGSANPILTTTAGLEPTKWRHAASVLSHWS
jgi:hypothetical protein